MADDKMTHTLHIRLTPQLHKTLCAEAEADKRAESELARILLEEGLVRRAGARQVGARLVGKRSAR